MKIILFEDSKVNGMLLRDAIDHALRKTGEVILFQPVQLGEEGTYEKRLEKELSGAPFRKASLIVADLDLSSSEQYRGLSEAIVRTVANTLAVPECSYARGADRDAELVHSAEQRESVIAVTLKDGPEKFADQVISIALGFEEIKGRLQEDLGNQKSPGKLLATILRKPEYADKISLYASGDQNRLANILSLRGSQDERNRRVSCTLGYWLWDSVLRYPGVVVNGVAAASYLNIHEEAFLGDKSVAELFQRARYDGPFANAKEALWWRGMLDDIVANSDAEDGRDFASRELNRQIRRSECCENPERVAGYYCMLGRKPVSFENSKGGLPWFPRGADLARVSKSKYDELGPWL